MCIVAKNSEKNLEEQKRSVKNKALLGKDFALKISYNFGVPLYDADSEEKWHPGEKTFCL